MAEPDWHNRLEPEDLRALTPLIYAHVNPYGRFYLDMDERLSLEDQYRVSCQPGSDSNHLQPHSFLPAMWHLVVASLGLSLHGFEDIELLTLGGYDPVKTPIGDPLAKAAQQSIRSLGFESKIMPIFPATLPIMMFNRSPLNLPFVISGLGHGWLLHAPNEYFEVEGLRASEKSAAAFLFHYAAQSSPF